MYEIFKNIEINCKIEPFLKLVIESARMRLKLQSVSFDISLKQRYLPKHIKTSIYFYFNEKDNSRSM